MPQARRFPGLVAALVAMAAMLAMGADAWALHRAVPLYKLAPAGTVDLKCVQGEHSITFPIPRRWQVNEGSMLLSYTNSIGLLGSRSQLAVKLNGVTVAQTRLNPRSPNGELDVIMPADLFEPGYNNIGFHVSQHYQEQCENFCAPDLWTTLNLNDTVVDIHYDLKPVPLQLSRVSEFLFDPKIHPPVKLNVVVEDLSEETVGVAMVLASSIARRFDYREVFYSVSADVVPGMDNIVVGRDGFASELMGRTDLLPREVTGPYVRVMHLPVPKASGEGFTVDKTHAMIIVSGRGRAELQLAATTFGNMTFPFPGTDELTAVEFSLPEIALYGGRMVLRSEQLYTLEELNVPDAIFVGINPPTHALDFRLPPDFLIKHNQAAKLTLNFSYGAGLKAESALNISVNGRFVKAIHLNSVSGEMIRDYEIDLPMFLFKPGSNKIVFYPVLMTAAKECEILQTGNLFLTIYGNSTFIVPAMPHFVELPNMKLFMLNGFPFTRWPDGYESLIYIPEPDYETVAAAMRIAGFITQRNGYPLLGITVGYEEPVGWNGEVLAIGIANSIPAAMWNAAPLKLNGQFEVPYPVVSGWEGDVTYATSRQISGLGPGYGALMEFQSPYAQGRTVVMVTAFGADDLIDLSEALLDPGVQGWAQGDLTIIDLTRDPEDPADDYKVTSVSVGEKYYVGKEGAISEVELFMHQNPYSLYVAIGVFVLAGSAVIVLVLMRIRRKRLASVGDRGNG